MQRGPNDIELFQLECNVLGKTKEDRACVERISVFQERETTNAQLSRLLKKMDE